MLPVSCVTVASVADSRFIQSNRDAAVPEGYDPVQRGWYRQAAAAGAVIVTDPYWDVMTNQMCTTIAAPVYIEGSLAGVIGLDVTLAIAPPSVPESDGFPRLR